MLVARLDEVAREGASGTGPPGVVELDDDEDEVTLEGVSVLDDDEDEVTWGEAAVLDDDEEEEAAVLAFFKPVVPVFFVACFTAAVVACFGCFEPVACCTAAVLDDDEDEEAAGVQGFFKPVVPVFFCACVTCCFEPVACFEHVFPLATCWARTSVLPPFLALAEFFFVFFLFAANFAALILYLSNRSFQIFLVLLRDRYLV